MGHKVGSNLWLAEDIVCIALQHTIENLKVETLQAMNTTTGK